MSVATSNQTTPRNALILLVSVTVVAIPAGFFTLLVESVGKEPPEPLLWWAVVAGPALLVFFSYAGRRSDQAVMDRGRFVTAVLTSFLFSVTAAIARLAWLISHGY
jgi:hypothetical protein